MRMITLLAVPVPAQPGLYGTITRSQRRERDPRMSGENRSQANLLRMKGWERTRRR